MYSVRLAGTIDELAYLPILHVSWTSFRELVLNNLAPIATVFEDRCTKAKIMFRLPPTVIQSRV